ncbi:hypothetical protein BDV95DRAFT_595655 [Massariosphaeria phaeospora]|uniref:2EXR domain-containing protein n=1 Tax=Massariosphaeria phaeospora TaxID=100035 RepID=A0A7C8I7D8_9PLEO|nr:hypothetical protein BDV95DRAFT_595655 [Massariosphaeria phaeospora]
MSEFEIPTSPVHCRKLNFSMNTSRAVLRRPKPSRALAAPKVFRFLDLPSEIRLMIYERLPVVTRHVRIDTDHRDGPDLPVSAYILVIRSVPTSILRTCHQIYAEASEIITSKIKEIFATPPKIIIEAFRLDEVIGYAGRDWDPVFPLVDYAVALESQPMLRFTDYRPAVQHLYDGNKFITKKEYRNFVEKAARQLMNYNAFADRDDGLTFTIVDIGITVQTRGRVRRRMFRPEGDESARKLALMIRPITHQIRSEVWQNNIWAGGYDATVWTVKTLNSLLEENVGGESIPEGSFWGPEVEQAEWDESWAEGEFYYDLDG